MPTLIFAPPTSRVAEFCKKVNKVAPTPTPRGKKDFDSHTDWNVDRATRIVSSRVYVCVRLIALEIIEWLRLIALEITSVRLIALEIL